MTAGTNLGALTKDRFYKGFRSKNVKIDKQKAKAISLSIGRLKIIQQCHLHFFPLTDVFARKSQGRKEAISFYTKNVV